MISAFLITAIVLILIGARLVSLATDIQAQVADISAKADAILAKLAQAKAEALTPEDLAALQAAKSGLSEVQGKLG